MANNRMYLVCNVCNDFVALAKTMGDGWYTRLLTEDLNEFFEKHDHNHQLEDGVGERQFTYVTEIDSNHKVKKFDFDKRKIVLNQKGVSKRK